MSQLIKPQAHLIEHRPVEGGIQAMKSIYGYRAHRYSVFYHPLYRCYQIGIARYDRNGWGILGRWWQDVLTTHAPTLEAAHATAQAEIDRMLERQNQRAGI